MLSCSLEALNKTSFGKIKKTLDKPQTKCYNVRELREGKPIKPERTKNYD